MINFISGLQSFMGSWFNVSLLIIEIAITFTLTVLADKFFKKEGLIAWVAIATILANIITNKQAAFFGQSVAIGTVIFASVFLATDIISEKYGEKEAKKAVNIALVSNIILIISTLIARLYIPGEFDYADSSIQTLFGGSFRISISSMIMFWIANMMDVYLFNKIKSKMNGKMLWVRNNICTITCNCVENFCFFTLAFVAIPFLGIEGMPLQEVLLMALITSLVEVVAAACDTPFLYWATHKVKN